MGAEGQPKLPVLDFSKEALKPGTNSWLLACKDVRQALEEFGCFVVLYDKISPEFRNAFLGALQELFDLSTQTKMTNKYEKPLNGYVGQIPKLPLHESLGIDNATNLEETQKFTKLMWPGGNDKFCESAYSFAKVAEELDQMVTRMIFESYGVEKYYDSYVGSISYLLRLLKNRSPQENEPSLGFVAHTDKSFTTILYQNNHVNALEFETRSHEWIRVEFPPSSFIVMAGDALMAWSNDRILSPNHRVIMSGNETRFSLAQFAFSDGEIHVPEELADEEHPLSYKSFDHPGLLRFFRSDDRFNSNSAIKAYCGV
ncbi:2-oxoglutarate-dependent dioxygenase AOP2-like [Prunus avium]|uniref:2-oxoglutarate-dependent dioxygenase AOP2-like n=1 Tax=Prunus avium TaxID=42229 RepID=A0A6P5SM55_PRUAV|nr:2-oxoglutarate-dependent dioxygenase AOP2-like [Prunus avium]